MTNQYKNEPTPSTTYIKQENVTVTVSDAKEKGKVDLFITGVKMSYWNRILLLLFPWKQPTFTYTNATLKIKDKGD